MFQYKVLHDTLYINKMLFKFGKAISPRCPFCKLHEETIMHLFYDCLIVKRIWNQLKSILSNNINFAISTPKVRIKDIENKLYENDAKSRKKFNKKWKTFLKN